MLEKIAVVSKLTAVAFVKFTILHLDLTPLTLFLLLLLCWLFTGRLVHLCACDPPAGWASTGCVLSVDAVWTHDHQDQHTRRPIPAPHQCSNAPTATSLPYAAAPTCARWNHQSHSVLTLECLHRSVGIQVKPKSSSFHVCAPTILLGLQITVWGCTPLTWLLKNCKSLGHTLSFCAEVISYWKAVDVWCAEPADHHVHTYLVMGFCQTGHKHCPALVYHRGAINGWVDGILSIP